MTKTFSVRVLGSYSGNRKSKTCAESRRSIQNLKWAGFLAVFLVGCVAVAQAQQPRKVPRLGYLSSQEPASDSARSEAIRLALRELGYIEGQNTCWRGRIR